jgi:hypothetical protein
VQVLPILNHDLGGQRIRYDDSKGLEVGGWSPKVRTGDCGYTWSLDTEPTHISGLLGCDWQPVISTSGVKSAVLSRDFKPGSASTPTADLYWSVSSDNGLKAKIDARIGANEVYLWCDSSCLAVTDADATVVKTTTDGLEYYTECTARQFGTPMQTLLRNTIDSQSNTYITTVPMSMVAQHYILEMLPYTISGAATPPPPIGGAGYGGNYGVSYGV